MYRNDCALSFFGTLRKSEQTIKSHTTEIKAAANNYDSQDQTASPTKCVLIREIRSSSYFFELVEWSAATNMIMLFSSASSLKQKKIGLPQPP